jgi:ribonuclease HI
MAINVYVDGACSGNPGPGGWAALALFPGGREQVYTGHSEGQRVTNNQMELTAIASLYMVLRDLAEAGAEVVVHSDSQYCIDCASKWIHNWALCGWRTTQGKSVKNLDLLKVIQKLNATYHITYKKVKAHAGDAYNERVDALAKEALRKGCKQYDTATG